MSNEAIERAWKNIYGTRFDSSAMACIHFANGFAAGKASA